MGTEVEVTDKIPNWHECKKWARAVAPLGLS